MEKDNKSNSRLLLARKIFAAILIAIVFYFFGYAVGHENLVFEKNLKPKIVNSELYKPRSVDFSIFWDAWNKVQEKYVGAADPQKMIYGAISGMMQSLGDPYSTFMDPTESQSFSQDLAGEVTGIGAQIDAKDGKILIVAPLSDSPAEKAGLKPQDQILKIDDTDTSNLTLDQAVSKIRGEAGSKVTLEIMRDGWSGPQTFTITREKVQVKSVNWKTLSGNIAYIQVTQFGDDTTDLFRQTATDINKQNPKGIIIDLRSNPGGYLESAIDIASLFGQNQVVVKEKYKDGHVEEDKTINLDPVLENYKTVILVNGGSASAAEILSGALQDWGKAVLVGEKTFGKGSVQELDELKGGSTLRVTIAKWFTPKDRGIDGTGIEPDQKVTLTAADEAAGKDPQLDKAIEIIGGK